jgi:DNA topoisomerase-1
VIRVGRYGPYLEKDGQRVNVPEGTAPDELTAEVAEELLSRPSGDTELGTDPATGRTIVAKAGRFGPYVTEVLGDDAPASAKPRSASLLKSMALDSITLDDALKLLTLPRTLGELDGEPVTAQNGRYGPYVKKGTDSRSLDSEDQLFTFTLAEAKDLFAQPKARGRAARAAAAPPLRELGEDPNTKKPIVLKEGRWGPYATDGETNASLRKGDDVTTVTLQRAAELLAERRAAGPPAPRRRAAAGTTARAKTAAKSTKAAKPAGKAKAATTRKSSKASPAGQG